MADDTLDTLEGLISELYANIAKHADPDEWYVVTILFDDGRIIVSASDTLKDAGPRIGLGSGLERYKAVVESMSGTFAVTDDADGAGSRAWSVEITLPLS